MLRSICPFWTCSVCSSTLKVSGKRGTNINAKMQPTSSSLNLPGFSAHDNFVKLVLEKYHSELRQLSLLLKRKAAQRQDAFLKVRLAECRKLLTLFRGLLLE